VHGDATRVNPLESEALAEPASTAVLQADADGINGATDAGLTPLSAAVPGSVVATVPDDRLFTISEVAGLLKVPKSVVYSACDRGDLQYVKFEGAVQVEGRDLKTWLATCHRTESSTP
jgi:excisionase family DNA binding protein